MEGRTISHYRIVKRMGAGGMGVVYRAEDTRLHRDVAIKFLAAELGTDNSARARFMQEARAASALDHPNICSVYDIGTDDDGRMYLVLAYYGGRTLDELLEKGPLPPNEAIGIAMQAVDGLARAHSRGIVHRDIKPSNLMMTDDGVLKILDFGLAKMAGTTAVTRTGTSVGTPRYMAPEQIRGETVDHRADIWSIGVLLYTMVTGVHPFHGEHPQAVMYAIVNDESPPLDDTVPGMPPELPRIVGRCLAKDPDERYQVTEELLEDLRRLYHDPSATLPARGTPTHRFSSSGAKRPSPRARARWSRRALLGVTLLTVVGAGVVVGRRAFGPRAPVALRVLVVPPAIDSDRHADDGEVIASSVRVSLVRGLGAMQRVVVVEPGRADEGASPREMARALSADELVRVEVEDTGRDWNLSLRRVDGMSDAVRFSSDVAVPYELPLLAADAVTSWLEQAYPERPMQIHDRRLAVSDADYRRFLDVYRTQAFVGANTDQRLALLDSLKVVENGSPDFVGAYQIDAAICRNLFEATREDGYLVRARAAAEKAVDLAPEDVGSVVVLFDVALRGGQFDDARRALSTLERLAPASVETMSRAARLAEAEGDEDRALSLMRSAVERRPTRDMVYRLADMEYRRGQHEQAREQLDSLLVRFPDFVAGEAKLAEVELLYGDPERAAELYSRVVAKQPTAGRHTNLGLARELMGEFDRAAEDFRRALAMEPGSAYAMLNLADCLAAAGGAGADSLYARVLDSFGADGARTWDDKLVVAQCLAHLGRSVEAVRVTQDALRESQEQSEALYIASLVYAVVGDRQSALVTAEKAMNKGVEPRWFRLPWFDAYRSEPEFARVHDD